MSALALHHNYICFNSRSISSIQKKPSHETTSGENLLNPSPACPCSQRRLKLTLQLWVLETQGYYQTFTWLVWKEFSRMTYFPGKWNKMWGKQSGTNSPGNSYYFSLFHILHSADTVETGLQIQVSMHSGVNVSAHHKEILSNVGIVT